MKIRKLALGFLILFLTIFMNISHAKLFTYDEICKLIKTTIPMHARADDYCLCRSAFLAEVIASLKKDDRFCHNVSRAKDFALQIFITSVQGYYPQNQECWCKAKESGIIADSSDYVELMKNLDNMAQAYSDLSMGY